MKIVKHNDFEELIDSVYQTHCLLQQNAQKAININLTIRNWLIGCYIVEFEQNGEDRAKYGSRLLEEMAKSLKGKSVKGLDAQSLRTCRTFYSVYPQLSKIAFQKLQNQNHIQIRGSVSRELQVNDNHEYTIQQTVSVELSEDYPIPSEVLLSTVKLI